MNQNDEIPPTARSPLYHNDDPPPTVRYPRRANFLEKLGVQKKK
jgi:hypothetical protein